MQMTARARTVMAGILIAQGCANTHAEQDAPIRVASVPQPKFADPDRRARLLTAMPAIDSAFRTFAEQARVPGIAYGVIVDGELVHTGTHGFRELETKSPVDTGTVFRIASMTKSFTALAILQLRDAGRLSLDDPADRYVPELRNLGYPSGDSPRITIRHLLSHSEGFPEDNPWGDRQLDATDADMARMMESGIPFSNAPGMAYEYSNYGFAILGRIVANVSGMQYSEYVAKNILEPLQMRATTLESSAVPAERLAHGYRWEDATWKNEPLLPDGAFGPMGGMLTSLGDLGRYVGFLMSAWPPRDEPDNGPVRRASLREMQQIARSRPTRVLSAGRGSGVTLNTGGYGYGLGISQTCDFAHVVAHSGGLPGFGSQMRWLPEHGVGIIALGNLTYTGWGGVISQALGLLSSTGALQPRVAQPAPALSHARDAVSRLVLEWSDALADSVAAMNLFLDRDKARRHRELDSLRTLTGQCGTSSDFQVENALRGSWRMPCEKGALHVEITLAPTVPPRVQHLEVRHVGSAAPAPPPSACPRVE